MKIISSYFDDELNVSNQPSVIEYTCNSKEQKINMNITEIPNETRTLVLVVDDPKVFSPNYVCCVGWNLMKPKDSPFTQNRDVKIRKEKFLKKIIQKTTSRKTIFTKYCVTPVEISIDSRCMH